MQKKHMFTRAGLAFLVVSFGVLSVSQMASAHTPGNNLSGKEKAAHAKTHKVSKSAKVVKAHKRTIPGKIVSITQGATTVTDATTGATTTSYLTMVIRKGNKDYTVNTTETTIFVDRKWKAITQSDLKVGHKVTIKGVVTGSDVVANWVRDVSLPAKTVSTTE